MSADGTVALGVYRIGSGPNVVFSWTEDLGLRTLDATGTFLIGASTLSANGLFAAGASRTAVLDRGEAAIWNTTTGARTNLGQLPGGQPKSLAYFVSDDGATVLGEATDAINRPEAFRWTQAGGMQSLGSLGAPDTTINSVNRDGSVAVGYGTEVPNGPRIATRWSIGGGLQVIPGLPPGATASSNSRIVSNDGRYVFGVVYAAFAAGGGFFYHDAVLGTTLTQASAGFSATTFASTMSKDGLTVLMTDTSTVPGTVFLWEPATGAMTTVDQSGEHTWNQISADGSALSGFRTVLATQGPVRWTASGGIESLVTLGGPFPTDGEITADGSTIFGQSNLPGGDSRAVIWRDSGQIGATYCGPAVPNSTGVPGELLISGTNASAAGLAELRASDLPVGATAFFLGSNTSGFASPVIGSEGALCLGGAIGRYVGPGQVQSVDASGNVSIAVDASQLATPTGPTAATFGESWYFQTWHRDVNAVGAATSNFSNGATVRFY